TDPILIIFLLVHLPTTSTRLHYTPLFRSQTPAGCPARHLDWRDLTVGRARMNWPLGRRFSIAIGESAGSHQEIRQLQNRADGGRDRKSTRLNSSHVKISYAVFCLKKKSMH